MSVNVVSPKFATELERFGARTALITEAGERMSYAELAKAADEFAARLAPDANLILIEGRSEIAPIVAYLGALRSGRATLMHPLSDDVLGSRISQTFQPDASYVYLNGAWRLEAHGRSTPCHPELSLLLSTSGTTGSTKLVRISASALTAHSNSLATYLELSGEDRAALALPIYFGYGNSVVCSHLSVGAAVLLSGRSVVDDAFWELANREGATSIGGVPHTFELLHRGKLLDRAPASLRTLTHSGGRISTATLLAVNEQMTRRGGRVFAMYGQTESTARISYLRPDLLKDNPDCIGLPIPGGEIILRDKDGVEITGPRQTGQLMYRGPNVMMGYGYGPEDLARGPEVPELATGDLAERTESGLYRIVGRLSRFVKPFGLRVALDEIEKALEVDGLEAMVAGTDSLIAVGVRDARDPAAIAKNLSERYRLPETLFHVTSLEDWPLLPTGKRDYKKLLADAEAARAASAESKGDTVAAFFAEYFPGLTITPQSSFVSLDGDSMNYVNMTVALESLLGDLPRGWETLTIEQLELLRSAALEKEAVHGRRAGMSVESDIAVRALAISAVVTHHASSSVYFAGGVAAIIALVGYSWARFQRRHIIEGKTSHLIQRLCVGLLLPYYVLLALFAASGRPVPPSAWLLFGDYDPSLHGFVQPLWYVSAYAQATLLLVIGIAGFAPFRRAVQESPWRTGMIGLIASTALVPVLVHFGAYNPHRSIDQVLPLICLGWSLAFADTPKRKLLTLAATAIAIFSNALGDRSLAEPGWTLSLPYWFFQGGWLIATSLLLLWLPSFRAPRWTGAATAAIASASVTIYLTHTAFLWGIGQIVDKAAPGFFAAAVSIAACVALHRSVGFLYERVMQRISARRDAKAARGAATGAVESPAGGLAHPTPSTSL